MFGIGDRVSGGLEVERGVAQAGTRDYALAVVRGMGCVVGGMKPKAPGWGSG